MTISDIMTATSDAAMRSRKEMTNYKLIPSSTCSSQDCDIDEDLEQQLRRAAWDMSAGIHLLAWTVLIWREGLQKSTRTYKTTALRMMK